jgi:hypothetical protein
MGFENTATPLRERRESPLRRESEHAARLSMVRDRGRATP